MHASFGGCNLLFCLPQSFVKLISYLKASASEATMRQAKLRKVYEWMPCTAPNNKQRHASDAIFSGGRRIKQSVGAATEIMYDGHAHGSQRGRKKNINESEPRVLIISSIHIRVGFTEQTPWSLKLEVLEKHKRIKSRFQIGFAHFIDRVLRKLLTHSATECSQRYISKRSNKSPSTIVVSPSSP